MSGEGEGSKATLVAWLKRRAEADFGHGVVGRNVWVCWYDLLRANTPESL